MVAAWPEALDEPVRQPDGSWIARFMPLPPDRCRLQQNANLPQLEEVRVSRQVNRHAGGVAHGRRQGWISALQNDPPFARWFAHTHAGTD